VDVDGVCTKVTAAQEGTASQAWQTLPASGDMPTGAQFAIYEGLGMHARLSSPKVGPDDAIYCGSLAGYLYKWAPDTGGVPSPFPISTNINNSGLSPILAAPATTDSYIYFATYDGRVFRVDPNGSNLISHATGKNIIVGPVIDSQGYVIVTCTDGTIYKLTSSLGTSPVWTANLPQRVGSCTVYAAPALTEGNDIYVGTDTGKVVKLSGSDGSSIATYTGSGVVCGNLLIDSDGYVYWGTSNSNTAGYLYRAPSNLSTASAYSLGLPCRGISMLWDGSIYAALAPHTQGDPILKLVGPADTQLVSPVCRVVLEDHLYVGPDPQPYVWSGHDNYAGTMSNQAVTIEFRPEGASSTTDALYSFVGYLSADNGTMTVPGVPSGTYDMYAKGLHWLRRVAAAVTVAPNMDVVNFGDELNPCLDGDVVDHNRVTTTDLGMILDVYASAKPEFDVPFYTDLNEDGHTSTTDLGIVLSNFGQFGD
jgi:outer membrane protein assembly factor BamB